jgi:thiamine biosynthesis lipoprotein
VTVAADHTEITGVPEAEGITEVTEVRFSAIGTTAVLVVTATAAASAAEAMLRTDLAELDRACSRFRADSEIRQLERTAGSPVTVSPLLAEIVDTALRAAQLTSTATPAPAHNPPLFPIPGRH